MKCMQYHKELLLEDKQMKLPNKFGSITKLSGNRRNPYMVRITTGWTYDNEKDIMIQERAILGYAKTRSEALEMLTQYNQKTFNVGERNTIFKNVYDRWYKDYLKDNSISRSSRLAYEAAIKDLKPIWDIPIRKLRTVDLQSVIDKCGKNYPTIRKIKLCLKQVYKYAMKYDIVVKDYSAFIDISKHKDKNPNSINRAPFTKKEIQTLWNNSNDKYTQILLIYIYTGVRASELLDLKKEHVDLKNSVFKVMNSKTESGIRTVPIADKIKPFIEKLYKESVGSYLIATPEGKKMLYRNYRDAYFKPLMLRYGMDHHIHDTRHTCISLLTMADVKPVTIKKIVGHKGAMSLTEKVYTHLDYKELLDAINRI